MKYSISTHCLADVSLAEALDTLSPLTSHIEVMSEGRHFLSDATQLSSYSVSWSIHAPSRGVNIASVLEPIRKASVKVITDTFVTAAELNAPVVFHPGFYAWVQERDAASLAMKKSLDEIKCAADEYGVEYFAENLGNWGFYFLKTTDDLDLFNCKFCLDVGHANECNSLDAFLEVPFSHVHLHDNKGDSDSHLAVGDGSIDFIRVIKKVADNHIEYPVLESATLADVKKSIEYLKILKVFS